MRRQAIYGGGLLWRMTRQRVHLNKLKLAIQTRRRTEDYTCRLPKPPKKPKPRVRYKLRLKEHYTLMGQGLKVHCQYVWK